MSDRSHSSCWRLEGARAKLCVGDFLAALDVERPSCGLTDLRIRGATCDWRLLRIGVAAQGHAGDDAPWQPSDVYVRGCDLVATYREPLGQPFNLQIYWRVVEREPRERLILETIVSVQTPAWEAFPGVGIGSQLPDGDAIITAENALVYRPRRGPSYVELSYPGDFALTGDESQTDDLSEYRWRFGPQFMEKGVIRRLRLRGAIVNHDDALAYAERLRADLLAEQPPLTA